MVRELESLLLPAPQTFRVGVEGDSNAIIDVVSSLEK